MGRLVEAHADAIAIMAEIGAPRCRWESAGHMAAGPADSVTGERHTEGWRLDGTKGWCSGASLVDHALVDASTDDGQRLFAVRLAQPGFARFLMSRCTR